MPDLPQFGAARLGKPSSLWARRFYSPAKLERSHARAASYHDRYAHLKHRFYDAIGGAPDLERRAEHPR